MQINFKKPYALVNDTDKTHTKQEPASLCTINGETLQAMNLDDMCRYLVYWGTGNGDMRGTKEVVRQKIPAAKFHLLTPELATKLCTSKGMGVFRFSAALIECSDNELKDVKQLCIQAYKNAGHLPWSTTSVSALFIFLKAHAGKERTLSMVALTQKWLLHAERCMRHEAFSRKNPSGRVKPHFRRTVMRLFCWTNWGYETVEVGWRNLRLLVETSKSTAAAQHLIHVCRAAGQQTSISACNLKHKLGCRN